MKILKNDWLTLVLILLINTVFQFVKVSNLIGVLTFVSSLYFLWYYFIKSGLKSLGYNSFSSLNYKKEFVGFSLFGLVLIISFFYKENYIHFWDSAGYWKMVMSYSEGFFSDYQWGVGRFCDSLLLDEYTLLPVGYLMLPMKLFGYDYVWFVVSIYIVFILPFFFLCFAYFQRIELEKKVSVYLQLLLIFSFSFFIVPLFSGFVGSMGLLLILVILFSSFFNLKDEISWEDVLVLSLSFVFLMFTRRWYLFWIVSFVLSFGLSHLFDELISSRTISIQRWKSIAMKFIPVGVLGGGVMLLFFRPFLKRVLFNDFHDIYSAYQSISIMDDIDSFYRYAGVFVLAFSVLGIVVCLRRKKLIDLFFFMQLGFCFFLFVKMNQFGYQHYYLLSIGVFYFFVHGVVLAISKGNMGTKGLIVILLLSSYYLTFINQNKKYLSSLKGLFTQVNSNPSTRNDIDELQRLVKDLKGIEDGEIYTLASSFIINDDIIKNVNLPREFNAVPKMKWVRHVDKRDGFPVEFFHSEYLVVATPIQIHLRKEDQLIVFYLAELVLEGGVLNDHYQKVNSYDLDEGVGVILYKKVKEISAESKFKIKEFFKSRYPEHEQLWGFNVMPAYRSIAGDEVGVVEKTGEGDFFIHPGNSISSTLEFDLKKQYSKLSFDAGFRNVETLRKECSEEVDGEVFMRVFVDGELSEERYITWRDKMQFGFNLSSKSYIKIEVSLGENQSYCDWFVLRNMKFL